MAETFSGNFTQQEPIPEDAIEAAVRVMRHGRLHRYNLEAGEAGEAALLEREFAEKMEAKYCLACASGGYALAVALRATGLKPGDRVLTNSFTLAPVPGAIANAGGEPVFVEITKQLVMDLEDLQAKIKATAAGFVLVSHMRGHIVDMDALMSICDAAGVQVIEDCAHTMGARWNGVPSGRHGRVGCFSTQTFKHVNSGEGGLLVSDDPEVMARATMLSGSYMLYGSHRAGAPEQAFEDIRLETPNCSGRMDNLRAAILRPQLARLEDAVARWNQRYQRVEAGLQACAGLEIIKRPQQEFYVGSSIQFLLPDCGGEQVQDFQTACAQRGVELKWFGANTPVGFTSRHDSWQYVRAQDLPVTDRILAGLMDMRLPLTFSLGDCDALVRIIRDEAAKL